MRVGMVRMMDKFRGAVLMMLMWMTGKVGGGMRAEKPERR